MWLLYLLIGRLNMPIIMELLPWIATTWRIHVIDLLKVTNIFAVGRLLKKLTQEDGLDGVKVI